MLSKKIILGLVIGLMTFFITSCDQDCGEQMEVCHQACEYNGSIQFCCTGAITTKYYFNKTTQQCEPYCSYDPNNELSFWTIEECQDCRCASLVQD